VLRKRVASRTCHVICVPRHRKPRRAAIPVTVYDKGRANGIALEKLGTERLWLALKPIWPDDRPHLALSKLAEWFASYVYLPKVRDGVVRHAAIRSSLTLHS
jgi:hypothetical protein